ncbi:uncharacterized protein F4807DRAFT_454604 [Annulohypoxylon truncatum]|uniref:uncharacterized protein n=1 Tax=Annulohypoxylon truncatum TaxID=327061 RepID=UPI0020074BF5|nr:uncharacterized protein F4807DRAFT_454604 [Annulohypoxylon truncatum]KAI1204556.1 hypothetical protein F4807DRAFT_454604 [Annulohypoxylon truncatum]
MADAKSGLTNNMHTPGAGHWIDTVVWILIGFATAFLGLRVFCKLKRSKGLWWDDWVLIASWLVLLVSGVLNTISVATVFFQHDQDERMGVHDAGLLTTITGTLFFVAAIWSKTSFAITLIRIAGPRLKVVLRIIIVSMNGITSVSVVLRWLQCRPTRLIWDSQANGTCWNRDLILGVTIFAAAYSALMDFVLAALPWPIIINLQMRTGEKIGISVGMSMGVCAGVTAIIKCTKFQVLRSEEFADDVFELSIWSVAEIATTIMAASIPVLRALVREATGMNKRLEWAAVYIRDQSRKVASRVCGMNASLVTPGRPKTANLSGGTANDDTTQLNITRTNGPILKMEEVHVEIVERRLNDSVDIEPERIPPSYSPWV